MKIVINSYLRNRKYILQHNKLAVRNTAHRDTAFAFAVRIAFYGCHETISLRIRFKCFFNVARINISPFIFGNILCIQCCPKSRYHKFAETFRIHYRDVAKTLSLELVN